MRERAVGTAVSIGGDAVNIVHADNVQQAADTVTAQMCELNARRLPPRRPAENVPLVESLRFAVPLWILELRGAQAGDLVRATLRCARAVGERGDNLMFHAPGEPTKSERDSAIIAFEGLARGLAAICLLEGQVDFAGLHWCAGPHADCPSPAPAPREPVNSDDIAQVVASLDEFGRMLAAPPAPDRDTPSAPSPAKGATASPSTRTR